MDPTVNVVYGKSLSQVAEALRRNVGHKGEALSGLEVSEVNVTVNDLTMAQE